MNVTALPADTPRSASTLRQRAAAALAGWRQWRAARGLTIDHMVDAGIFTSLLIVWACGYVLLCPPSSQHSRPTAELQSKGQNHRHVDFAQVSR